MQGHDNYQLIHQFNAGIQIFKRPLSLNVTFKREISDLSMEQILEKETPLSERR